MDLNPEDERKLRESVPSRAPEDADPRIDGQRPSLILEPPDMQSLEDALRHCDASGLAVVPVGGGTRLSLGNLPRRLDTYMSTAKLADSIDYEPSDLTVSAGAGMRLSALQEILAKERQFLPVEPPLAQRATLGGVFAVGEPGFRRRPGARPRDLLLGFEAVLPNGDSVKAGGRVVKNVAGYELTKLMVGSSGTLAVLARLSLRVRAMPENKETVVGRFENFDDIAEAVAGVGLQAILPEGAAVCSPRVSRQLGTSGICVVARFEGLSEEVESGCKQAEKAWKAQELWRFDSGATDRLWEMLRDFPLSPLPSGALSFRLHCRPAETLGAAARFMEGGDSSSSWVAFPDGGLCFGQSSSAEDRKSVDMFLRRASDSTTCVVERAPREVKESKDVYGLQPNGFQLMKAIKSTFDPNGTLSPGRYVGRL